MFPDGDFLMAIGANSTNVLTGPLPPERLTNFAK